MNRTYIDDGATINGKCKIIGKGYDPIEQKHYVDWEAMEEGAYIINN